ncbi:MAG: site-specific integrase [Prevotella sp.]|nr:site-specific integrase [Prevotella sp.]
MKVEKATIKLVLRTNKVLSNGSHPIMIRINWNGQRAEKSTGYSCKKSEWNERTSLLKEGKGSIENAAQINIVLTEKIRRAEHIRNNFILNKQPYSAAEIVNKIDEIATENRPSTELHKFVIEYQTKRHLKLETIGSINTSIKSFTNFMNKSAIYLTEITKTDVESFGRWLTNKGHKTNTVIVTLRNISAIFSYAVECGLIQESPFKNFNISKKYKQENHTQPISKNTLTLFKRYYLECLTTMGSNDIILKDAMKLSSKLFAMNVFLMSYELQGLAMVDMANLTSNEVKDMEFSPNGEGYLLIVTHRSKTGKEVRIVLEADAFNYPLFIPYLENMLKTDRLFPIFRKQDDTEKKKLVRIRYATEWVNRKLHGHGKLDGYKAYVGIWREYNEWLLNIVKDNCIKLNNGMIVNKDNVKSFLIKESTTFYAARHTFASNYINSEGATAGELAALLGRNVSGIDRYIKELQTVQDIIAARNKMK